MKNYLLKVICLIALAVFTLPIEANDYLKIYFKDGHTERHYMKLVESISTTKYDLEGNLHSDYQMQQIVMRDTTYSYYLADIDSMSFTKVYEEQLKTVIENAASTIESLYQQSSTVEEMETHIDELKRLEGVEDVWREDDDIVVKFRDWYTVFITYPPKRNSAQSRLKDISNKLYEIGKAQQHVLSSANNGLKAIIAFQMEGDDDFSKPKGHWQELREQFEDMGFDEPELITGKDFDLDFIERRMFDYNIVIFDTHGAFYRVTGKHPITTGESYDSWTDFHWGAENMDADDVSCSYHNGILYKQVNEDFIEKSKYRFKSSGPHIVFIGACSIFKGNLKLIRKHGGKEESIKGCSRSMADVFFAKGADVCMGYNNKTSAADQAGTNYFRNMLNGASQEQAFMMLPPEQKDETEHGASLIDLVNPNLIYDNPKSIFIVNTHTVEKTKLEINDEYKKNKKIELKGVTSFYNHSGVTIGFRWSTERKVDRASNYHEEEANIYDSLGKEKYFSLEITPELDKTIYYRAFTFDGIHYNWGEESSFKIPKPAETDIITFADPNVKAICVANWDTNHSGELSKEEAAAVWDLGKVFESNKDITSFNELQYFTRLTEIRNLAFYKCSGLTSVTIPNSVTSIQYHAFRDCI